MPHYLAASYQQTRKDHQLEQIVIIETTALRRAIWHTPVNAPVRLIGSGNCHYMQRIACVSGGLNILIFV
jgi:hypothetical protein